jgi:hypothetical protein
MDDDHFGDVIRLEEVDAVDGFKGGAYGGEIHHCSFVLLAVDSDFQGDSSTDVSSLSIQIHLDRGHFAVLRMVEILVYHLCNVFREANHKLIL